jgi:hypothetical protein
MSAASSRLASPRLQRLVRRTGEERRASEEVCDLCGEPIGSEHRHLLDTSTRELKCACRACTILFDHRAAGGGHFRLLPDRRLRVDDFSMDDAAWAALRIPVDMAFFFDSAPAERVVAMYPSPMGATESLLELDTWEALVAANPVLEELEPDLEALLVNRARGARQHWIVPLDDCYELVGLIRLRWKGLSGGTEVWQEIERFFEELSRRAKPATRRGTKEVA